MADLSWLSDARWAVIEPFIPRNQPGPEREDDQRIISGALAHRGYLLPPEGLPPHRDTYDKPTRNYVSAIGLAEIIAFWC